jgi:hypothetical protein
MCFFVKISDNFLWKTLQLNLLREVKDGSFHLLITRRNIAEEKVICS